MSEVTNLICKDCGKPFSISKEEMDWIKSKGLTPFKRCADCRKKRRNQVK